MQPTREFDSPEQQSLRHCPALKIIARSHRLFQGATTLGTLLLATGCSKPVVVTESMVVTEEQLFKTNGLWYLRGTTNLFTGTEMDYHTNGVLRFRMTFTNGLPYGTNTAWHPNGTKQTEGEFVDGKRSGLWNMWFDDGKPDKQGTFVNGKPDGLQIFWHTNGVKSVEWYHKEGIPHGNSKSYYMNGQLHQEGSYDMGRQIGEWAEWDEDGNKTKTAQFENGQIIKETNLTEPASIIPPQK